MWAFRFWQLPTHLLLDAGRKSRLGPNSLFAGRGVRRVADMDVDFDAAARRFSKEVRSRKDADRKKTLQKEADKRVQAIKQARWEAEAAARREEEQQRQAAEAAAREEDLERNRGVAFVQTLRPELSHAAEAKGIVRRADKITLPRSASLELEAQQASRLGQLFFELHNPASGRTTHASILDFSALEGTVGLPEEVLANLGISAEAMAAERRPTVQVRFRALKVAKFARVQPVVAAFASDVSDVKAVLERALHFRTTLSAGDEVWVGEAPAPAAEATPVDVTMGEDEGEEGASGGTHSGTAPCRYAVRIISLDPDNAASIIDTDLEVDVMPSVEAEEAEKAEAAAAAAAQAALDAAKRAQAEAAVAAARAAAEAEAQAAAQAAEAQHARAMRRDAAQAALPDEPADGAGVGVAVRCPDGTRCLRRLDPDAPLLTLFSLVDASEWEDAPASGYALVASYPRRVFRRAEAEARTLRDAGLTGKQEAFFVELVEE